MDSGERVRQVATIALVVAAGVWFAAVWRQYLPAGLVEPWANLRAGFALPWPLKLNPWWTDFLAAALLAFVAHCAGARLIDRLPLGCRGAERVLLSTAAGVTVLLLCASALALPRLFRPAALKVVVAGFAVLAAVSAPDELGRLWRWKPRPPLLFSAVAALFFLCALVLAAMPEVSPDGLQFHLLYPQYFLERGTFYMADLYRSNIPLYAHVLYGIGIALHGFGLSRFLQFLFLPGTALCVYVLASCIPLPEERRAPAGALAVAALASSPVVLLYSVRSYPDLPVAFFECVAIYCAIRFLASGGQGSAWPALAGVFAGMAAGTKYAGLYAIPVIGVLCALAAWRRGRRPALRAAFLAASLAALIACPWYIRNWIHTGDPLYPTLYRRLQKPVIDPFHAANLLRDARNTERFAMTPGNIARLPWLLTMEGNRVAGSLGPLFLWVLPLILLAARLNPAWMAAAATALVLSLLWMLGPQWMRYYLPVLPLWAALGAHAIYRIERRGLRWMAAVAALALIGINLPPLHESWVAGGIHVAREVPFDIAFGARPPSDYQRERVPGFTAAERLQAGLLPAEARILPVYSSELPRALLRQQVLDVFDAHDVICRDAAGQRAACYQTGVRDLQARLDWGGVSALANRRETRDLARTGALTLEDPFLRTGFRFVEYAGDTYLFERRRGERVIGERYVQYDLLARLATRTEVQVSSEDSVRLVNQRPRSGEQRPSIVVLPGNEVRFELQLGRDAQLAFGIGMPLAAARGARGVILEVLAGPEQRIVFSRPFRPEDAAGGWQQALVDLGPFSDSDIVITFRTRSAFADSIDWVGFSEPVVYARDAGEPLPRWPWMVSFDRHSLAVPVDVAFDPPRIRPGEYYTVSIPALAGAEIDVMAGYTGKPPDTVLRWTRLDPHGRSRLFVPPMAPGVMQVHAVRRSGARRWLAALGEIELLPHYK